MTTTHLFAYPAAIVPDPDIGMRGVVFSREYNNGSPQFLYLCDHDPSTDYPGGTKIGEWNPDGSIVGSVHSDYADYIRPIHNGDDGRATDQLDFHKAAGTGQRYLQEVVAAETMAEYPADNQPFKIKYTRTYITDDGFPHIPWGFHAELTFVDPNRVPNAYSIGVYSDAECTAYLWTPGAWIWADTGRVDDEGAPVFAWQIDCPVGQRTADRTDWHIANLLGSEQQGIYSLLADQDEFERYFWET